MNQNETSSVELYNVVGNMFVECDEKPSEEMIKEFKTFYTNQTEFIQIFENVIVVITPSVRDSRAHYDSDTQKIYLDKVYFEKESRKTQSLIGRFLPKPLLKSLHHELIHKYQCEILPYLQILIKKIEKIDKMVDVRINNQMRINVEKVFLYIMAEGPAVLSGDSSWNRKSFYKNAFNDAKHLNSKIGYLDLDNATPSEIYSIAKHLYLTLTSYLKQKNILKLAELNRKEAILLYEKAMAAENKKPVISWESGKGILDYQKLLKEARNFKL